ncbi:MAG: hypothetical protein QW687_02205 [Candidatus Hadarchaeales archaeon]
MKKSEVIYLQDEISEKLKHLSMGNRFVPPELWELEPWMANWVKEKYRWEEGVYHRLAYEEFMEWAYRVWEGINLWRRMLKENPKTEELITTEWLGYLGAPPGFITRPDLVLQNFPFDYPATFVWFHLDFWKMEFDWAEGIHFRNRRPSSYWAIGVSEDLASHMTEEERMNFPRSYTISPTNFTYLPYRKDLTTGLRLFELPRKYSINPLEWFPAARNIVRDFLDEMLPCWSKFPLVLSLSPGVSGIGSQQSCWSFSGFISEVWLANQNYRLGWPFLYYGYDGPPTPEQHLIKIITREGFVRLMSSLYLRGPKGLLCDAVGKNSSPPKKTPLLHSIRKLTLEGKMFREFARPFDDGIPPPRALLTAMPAPIYKETTLKELNLWENPENLPKEYKELLEAEAGVDFKTGRVPPYDEVPRLKWLFDPTIEWLKPKDFPPIDWSKGQVWPLDITREKMEIMVEEGYDGSGKDLLHYSCLADRKLGQYGKTIMLGTMPYKLPEE